MLRTTAERQTRGASELNHMKQTSKTAKTKILLYAVLGAVLLSCLWIGWHDFDPRLSQSEVREGIRSSIRMVVQIAVQYVIPILILGFFIGELYRWIRSKVFRRDPDA